MSFFIRKYQLTDEQQTMHLMNNTESSEMLANKIQNDQFTDGFCAWIDKQIIGTIFTWKNNFHPNGLYLEITLHPAYFQQNIVEALFHAVERENTKNKPYQASFADSNQQGKQIYEWLGFHMMRKTFMPTLSIQSIEAPNYFTNQKYFRTLKQIETNRQLVKNLTEHVKKYYEMTHQANPVATFSNQIWEKLIFAPDLLLEDSYVYLNEQADDILAYSFLHTAKDEQTYELGWCAYQSEKDQQMLLDLVKKQIDHMKVKKIHTLIGEFDTTDPYAMKIYRSFPFDSCIPFITYQKR